MSETKKKVKEDKEAFSIRVSTTYYPVIILYVIILVVGYYLSNR